MMQCCIIIFAACPGPDHFLQSIVQSPGVIQGFGQGWHIGGILPITDMPILICHNRYPSLYKYPHRYPPICNRLPILHIGSNAYRYRYIGFADMGCIGRYFISADADMPTLVLGSRKSLSNLQSTLLYPNSWDFHIYLRKILTSHLVEEVILSVIHRL